MSSLPTLAGRSLQATAALSPRLAGRLAFRLFCYPGPRARVRPSEHDVLERAATESLSVLGHRIATYRWGTGARPVLMLHGWVSRGSRYAALVPALLARGLSPVTFDAPGHGRSSGRSTNIHEYAALAAHLHERWGPFHAVIAHSFGALTAFEALRHSPGIPRAVTISSPCQLSYLPGAFAERLRLDSRIHADLRLRMERFFGGETRIWERLSAPYQAHQLKTRLLLVHDEDDTVVDFAQAKLIADAFGRRTELLATSGLGHHRILSAPDVVQRAAEFVGHTFRPTPA